MEQNDSKELFDFETLVDYAQLAFHTLKNSGTEITAKELKNELKMLHNKFGTKEVRRLNKIILKSK